MNKNINNYCNKNNNNLKNFFKNYLKNFKNFQKLFSMKNKKNLNFFIKFIEILLFFMFKIKKTILNLL